jgi:hypothetical protein
MFEKGGGAGDGNIKEEGTLVQGVLYKCMGLS